MNTTLLDVLTAKQPTYEKKNFTYSLLEIFYISLTETHTKKTREHQTKRIKPWKKR